MNDRKFQELLATIAIEAINNEFDRMAGNSSMFAFSQRVDDIIRVAEKIDPEVANIIHDNF